MPRKGGKRPRSPGSNSNPDAKKQKPAKDDDGWYITAPIDMKNELMEKFYKENPGVIPEGEFDDFMACLKTRLLTTFRLADTPLGHQLRDYIKSHFCKVMAEAEVDGQRLEPPRPLAWYPNELGWHVPITRSVLRKNPICNEFHQFLIAETDQGNVSRQEAVSMLPPFFLDIEPHHRVLDACAAPGSKTAQLLEMLSQKATKETPITGFVVANDSDVKRCYLLTHQLQRLEDLFPNVLITNHDVTQYPSIEIPSRADRTKTETLKFDRILCDVMCSGDGTIRKAPEVWKRWSPVNGNSLHRLQISVAVRAMQMLEVGGLAVYSTCSMNPVEDEAVVAELLRRGDGCVELVDCSERYPELKRCAGLHSWKVMDNKGDWWNSIEEMPRRNPKILPGFFPPPADVAKAMHLERCMRILPHHQDTGGFFVALLRKTAEWRDLGPRPAIPPRGPAKEEVSETPAVAAAVPAKETEKEKQVEETPVVPAETATTTGEPSTDAPMTTESGETSPSAPAKDKMKGQGLKHFNGKNPSKDENLTPVPADAVAGLKSFFALPDDFPMDRMFARTEKSDVKKVVFVSEGVRDFLIANNAQRKFRVINAGVRVFEKNDPSYTGWRLAQEGANRIYQYMLTSPRTLFAGFEDMALLLTGGNVLPDHFKNETLKQKCAVMEEGGCLVVYDPSLNLEEPNKSVQQYFSGKTAFSAYRGKHSLSLQISKVELKSIRVRFGVATEADKAEAATETKEEEESTETA